MPNEKLITPRSIRRRLCLFGIFCLFAIHPFVSFADDGYRLWLKYDKIQDTAYHRMCYEHFQSLAIIGASQTLEAARAEIKRGLGGLLATDIKEVGFNEGQLVLTKYRDLPARLKIKFRRDIPSHKEGYFIRAVKEKGERKVFVVGQEDIGILYGTFHLLKILQARRPLEDLPVKSTPKIQWRMLNHWDNLNRTVERGYAGLSIWQWDELPATIDERYVDYARANASIGINGVAVNNVNASPDILKKEYLQKLTALADVFRPYGIRLFVSVNFAAPKAIGKLPTADPLNMEVQHWWNNKVDEIYQLIPDFGGFLVKANSEGQPGPQDYGRSHVDGANSLAKALVRYDGTLIWRAFVYENRGNDRVKDPYDEFAPFDGQFLENVFVQTKNGPLDFQPREPFSPLFGALPSTSQMMELQITQEYTGFSTHLVYLSTLYKEMLNSDTYAGGKSATVAKIVDGTAQGQSMTGMAGVSNIGDVRNWTGHPFAQANWYAFGRLAWNHELSSEQIAEEWIRMTLTNELEAVEAIKDIMAHSYENMVNYMMPLGLNVLSSLGHHYGPQPWRRENFHRANKKGIGYDRSTAGSNAVSQYFEPLSEKFDNLETCPESLLLWFHHVPWDHRMQSGRTLWEELCFKYNEGLEGVRRAQQQWDAVRHQIDEAIFKQVAQLLAKQEDEAFWWRDACLGYFSQISGLTIPEGYEPPRYNEADLKRKERQNQNMKHYSQ